MHDECVGILIGSGNAVNLFAEFVAGVPETERESAWATEQLSHSQRPR
jgi:hypothetical protein